MIFNPTYECMERSDMEALQLFHLKETVRRAYEKVPHFKMAFDEAGVKPEDLKTLADLKNFPFARKKDLRENYPYGMLAVPMDDIVRIHASSGTTGKPTVVAYTKHDLEMWSEAMARLIAAAGGTKGDIAQISFGYGLFTGALGLHYGLEKLGAAVIPISAGNTEKQIMLMQDLWSTLLISTPSYALYMAEVMEEMGVTKDDIHLRVGLFGGEGSTDGMMAKIEEKLGILATENYGLSEIIGPGVSGNCYVKEGLHINEDLFYAEIIDPETGEVLPVGETGELVLTTLQKEGLPMIRYRTGDLTRLYDDPCPCGRKTRRMERVKGRSDDMLIIKGVNVFPSQIEEVLMGIPAIGPHYQLVLTTKNYTDQLEVQVELTDDSLLDDFQKLENLSRSVQHKLHTVLGLTCQVRLMEPKTLARTAGKAKRVVDNRVK
ncbi:phenylacetate--CoA ligase family protein [Gehongia tenuis]|jgi:phenylacetate-CoA ligase|uniref:Phenylacetate-coenzyme A ligase n=1 Tax=Gehongia tenuis TaxID=2763655 RepID=A0A926D1D6_9FIRM|nr:phenylacetate--CoA ligase [Gehongia tenuis]MBC8530590.1 phenylacetate--CoA ligase [Gehongia tenuis]